MPTVRGRAGVISAAGRDELRGALETWIARHRIPGASLTLADASGATETVVAGFADVEAGIRVTPAHRFQIGSIGKSLTALALLRLAGEGRVDLAAPATRYLPWFETSLGRAITLHELLAHTSGLPMGGDFSEAGLFDVWTLRDVGPGGRPGRWSYSNVGYKVLGMVLEAVADRSYGEAVDATVLAPLGMTDTRAVVRWAEREGEAVGYEPAPDSFPVSRAPRVRAPWMDLTTGDGSASATGPDMGRYAAMLASGGSGVDGRILDRTAFARLVGRHARIRRGLWAGYGLAVYELDGQPAVGHGGDMAGFGSSLVVDLGTGIGAVMLASLRDAPCRPLVVYALRLARAERRLGPRPDPLREPSIDETFAFEGTDVVDGEAIRIRAIHGSSRAAIDGTTFELFPLGDDEFEVDDQELGRYLLRLERDVSDRVVGATHGRHRYTAATTRAGPPRRPGFLPAVGRYASHNPWRRSFDVVDRHGRLVIIETNGTEELLVRVERGLYRVGPAGSPEWIRFDAVVDGRALRATATGYPYYRVGDVRGAG